MALLPAAEQQYWMHREKEREDFIRRNFISGKVDGLNEDVWLFIGKE